MPGHKQKAAWAAARGETKAPRRADNQIKEWLESWAWGNTPAIDVVNQAKAHVLDNGQSMGIDERVVKLSKAHSNPGNAQRALEGILPIDNMPAPVKIDDSLVEWVVPPHEMMRWLQETSQSKFEKCLGGKPGGVADWWAEFRAQPKGREMWDAHPWLKDRSPSDLSRHLPLMIFDDAGPVSNTSSSFIRCFYSLLGGGSERETRFLIGTGIKEEGKEDRSWVEILKSFEQLAQPMGGDKWGGILLFVGADLEYICNIVGLPHFNSVRMCADCCANTTDCPHNDFGPNAAWRDTVKTNEQYMASIKRPLHPLAAHPLFNRLTFRHDLLHMLDHHGVASSVVANLLWDHVRPGRETSVLPGNSIGERVEFLNAEIKAWYHQQPNKNVSRLPLLKPDNLKEANSFPELHGHGVKAANTRGIVPFVLMLQERAVRETPSMRQKHMLKVIASLADMYDIFYSASHFLTPTAQIKLRKACYRLGIHYQALQMLSLAAGDMFWKSSSKLHYTCAHLCEQAALVNPRAVQGYMSESLVGVICDIYKLSLSGPFHRRVQHVALLKYRTGLFFLWA